MKKILNYFINSYQLLINLATLCFKLEKCGKIIVLSALTLILQVSSVLTVTFALYSTYGSTISERYQIAALQFDNFFPFFIFVLTVLGVGNFLGTTFFLTLISYLNGLFLNKPSSLKFSFLTSIKQIKFLIFWVLCGGSIISISGIGVIISEKIENLIRKRFKFLWLEIKTIFFPIVIIDKLSFFQAWKLGAKFFDDAKINPPIYAPLGLFFYLPLLIIILLFFAIIYYLDIPKIEHILASIFFILYMILHLIYYILLAIFQMVIYYFLTKKESLVDLKFNNLCKEIFKGAKRS